MDWKTMIIQLLLSIILTFIYLWGLEDKKYQINNDKE